MKKNLIKKVAVTLLVTIFLASCDASNYSNTSNCPITVGAPTVSVTGPSAAAINEEVTLNVSYKTKKNCGDFINFSKQSLANQRIITVNVVYDACACSDATETNEVEPFKFKESEAGLYVLKFKTENDLYVVHNITVGEATN